MKPSWRIVLAVAPWIAVLIVLWREQTLERAVADFAAKANAAIMAQGAMPIPGEATVLSGEPPIRGENGGGP